MGLSAPERKKLQEALISAFPSEISLEQMLANECNKNLNAIAGGGNLKDIVFKLIKEAEAKNWIKDLVDAARKSNPENTELKAIAEKILVNHHQETLTPPPPLIEPYTKKQKDGRREFLYLALGGVGLVTAVLASYLSKNINPNPPLLESKSPIPDPLNTHTPTPTTTPTPTITPPDEPPPPPPKSIPSLEKFSFEVVTVNSRGIITKRIPSEARFFKEDLGGGVTLEMVYIPGGSFMMGTKDEEVEKLIKQIDSVRGFTELQQKRMIETIKTETPQHQVEVPAFFIGKFEVTQEQYQQVVMGENPSESKGDKRPVENIFWDNAVEFCKKLSQNTARTYRLPSEAEWEYACRAGTTTTFSFGETITTELVNYNGHTYADEINTNIKNSQKTTKVGSFPYPNAFGLYDMHGNVWEWCRDTWNENYNGAPIDGSARTGGIDPRRVLRGGSYTRFPEECRSTSRFHGNRTRSVLKTYGFRVVCDADESLLALFSGTSEQ